MPSPPAKTEIPLPQSQRYGARLITKTVANQILRGEIAFVPVLNALVKGWSSSKTHYRRRVLRADFVTRNQGEDWAPLGIFGHQLVTLSGMTPSQKIPDAAPMQDAVRMSRHMQQYVDPYVGAKPPLVCESPMRDGTRIDAAELITHIEAPAYFCELLLQKYIRFMTMVKRDGNPPREQLRGWNALGRLLVAEASLRQVNPERDPVRKLGLANTPKVE